MLNAKENAKNLLRLHENWKGFLELVAFKAGKGPIKKSCHVELPNENALQQIIDFWLAHEDCDLYEGVHVRSCKPDPTPKGKIARSKAEDVTEVDCLYVDVDAKDFGGDMNKVEESLSKVPFPAHYRLNSGHGRQARWLLDEVFDVSEPENLSRYENIMRRLQHFVQGDSVNDLARLLRTMGSVNRKFPDEPVQTTVELNFDLPRISLAEWDAFLPPLPPNATKHEFDIEFPVNIPEVPWDKLPKWFTLRKLKADRSDQDFYACSTMLGLGLTFDEIYAVYQQTIPLTERYQEECQRGHGDEYLKSTLNAALSRLEGNAAALISPQLQPSEDNSLDRETTAKWIDTCLQCDKRQWSTLLWQVRVKSQLQDKAFSGLVVNRVYELFSATSFYQQASQLNLTYDAKMPFGYTISRNEIVKLKPVVKITEGSVQVRLGDIALGFVTAILNRQVDENGLHYFEIVHYARKNRETIVVPGSTVFRATDITLLADRGLDISSNDSKGAVEYFKNFVHENQDSIPVLKRITKMGWHGEGFIYGNEFFYVEDAIFPNTDGGEKLLVKALDHRKGTLERQLELTKRALEHPKIALGIYASFAAPLLSLWNEQGFLVDYAGTSSVGKSTTLQVIGSLWGQADKRGSAENLIHSWKGTYPGHERYLEFMQNIPCFLDETKTMIKDERTREIVVDVAYSAANGIGKARAKIQGTQAPSTWRTVLLSTGEQPLSGLSKDGGLQARVIQVWGTPFSGNATKELVDWFDQESYANSGWLGNRFIGYTVEHLDEVRKLKDQLREIKRQYFQTTDSISARHADYYAVIALAGRLLHQVFPELGEFDVKFLDELFLSTVGRNSAKTQGYVALEMLESLAGSEPEAFRRDSTANVIKGRIQNLSADNMRYVAVLPSIFEDLMRKYGLDGAGVLREWEEKGWLDTGMVDGSRKTNKFKCGDSKMYRLQIKNLPLEFRDGFRDPKFWTVVGDSVEEAQQVEQERSNDKVVPFPAR